MSQLPECICPDENTRLGNCPRHMSLHRAVSPKPTIARIRGEIEELQAALTKAEADRDALLEGIEEVAADCKRAVDGLEYDSETEREELWETLVGGPDEQPSWHRATDLARKIREEG